MHDKIHNAITSFRYSFIDEDEFQEGIERALKAANIPYVRECVLSDKDRIDFICGDSIDIGIEAKIKGCRHNVMRQLSRYAESDRIKSLVLITSQQRLRSMPGELNGKKLSVIYVGSWC